MTHGSHPRWRVAMGATAAVMLVILLGLVLAGCSVAKSAPDVKALTWNSATIIYDRTGAEVYRLHAGENRTPVALNVIPSYVQDAFIAIEDPRFREHHGIDVRGLTRAVWRTGLYMLKLPGGRLEGGSTITQQLARDGWLTQDVSVKRKAQEAWLALQLERTYSKDQILEMYLNQIYFGHGAYGIEAAARTFFGKEVGELTLAEGAQLAGMINGPSIYDPYVDMEASLGRRELVLDAMVKAKMISPTQRDEANAVQPVLGSKEVNTAEGNAFIDYVVSILQDQQPGLAQRYGIDLGNPAAVARAGLKVYTTLDPKVQAEAEQAVADQMNRADKEYGLPKDGPRPEAAAVAMNPKTGEVLAMVGGRERQGMLEFNRATQALRQPGSAIKPLAAYIPALEAGLSPATILDDAPVRLSNDGTTVWPQNYDFKYQGLKPMRYGVEQSINPMAVRAMQAGGGPARAAEVVRSFGLTTVGPEDENLALALGGISKGTTVLDLTAAYSGIANLGTKVDPVVITKIVDQNGQTIFEAHPKQTQVTQPSVAYLMVDMMKGVIRRGTAYGFTGGLKGWPAAGKTGTTEDNRDAWFVGFTPDMVLTVWNGYDNPDNHLKWTGAFVPVKIWNQIATRVVTEKPADWGKPDDVISAPICRLTGMKPDSNCPQDQVASELFIKGTEPTAPGNLWVKAKAVQVTVPTADKKGTTTQWQLWQSGCMGQPVERLFIKRPEPRVTHPTDPYNPKYVPLDAKDELPTVTCKPVSLWDRIFGPKPEDLGKGEQVPDGNGTPVPGSKGTQVPDVNGGGFIGQPGQR